MTLDTALGILGLTVGVVGLAITIGFGAYPIWDARDQRSKKDKALAIIYGPLHEARRSAVTLKAYLTAQPQIGAVNDS